MGGLRILLTNCTMADRHGSVTYLRDLALGLLRQGHRPAVYTPDVGAVGAELRAATVPVVADLGRLGEPPDVVHGHSNSDLVAAMTRFPDAPAVFVCHAWDIWHSEPPRLPRVRRYVAVDETCRDWLVCQRGVPAGQVRVVLNAVDTRRFRPRPPLPPRPRRALVFSNYAEEQNYLRAVRQACGQAGVPLDVVGGGVGNPCDRPEAILGDYDLVFAKARCAQEAMAVGAAVLLCDKAGCGPLVTAANWGQLRRFNFGRRVLDRPVTAELLAAEIGRYDSADAAEVSRRMRREAGLDDAVAAHLAICREVVEEHAAAPRADARSEWEALALYLQDPDGGRHLFHHKHVIESLRAAMERQGHDLQAELARREGARQAAVEEVEQLRQAMGGFRAGLAARGAARQDPASAEVAELRRAVGELRAELNALRNSAPVRWGNRLRKVPLLRGCLRALAALV